MMMVEARPVTVMQPAIMPAIAHATATAMQFFAPAENESIAANRATFSVSASTVPNFSPSARSCQLVNRKLMNPMTNAPIMEMAALAAMVRTPDDTSHTKSTSGRIR